MRINRVKMVLTLLTLLATPFPGQAWERGKVERFATLPPGEAHPEGICVDRDGNVYVVTVAANKPETSPGALIVFDSSGKHLRTVSIAGSSRLLLDVRFHPQTGELLVIDYQAAKVLKVDPRTGASSVFMTVKGKNPGLDGMTFDVAGNVYVTDAHEGIIWKVGKEGGAAAAWVTSPLLKPTRPPPSIGERLGVQQQTDGDVRRQHGTRHDRENTGERLAAQARHAGGLRRTARAVDRTASSLTRTTTCGSRAISPTRSSCSSRRRAR